MEGLFLVLSCAARLTGTWWHRCPCCREGSMVMLQPTQPYRELWFQGSWARLWVSRGGALGQNWGWTFSDWTQAVSPRANHTGAPKNAGDALHLQTPPAPFHLASLSKGCQMPWEFRARLCWCCPSPRAEKWKGTPGVAGCCHVPYPLAGWAEGSRSPCLLLGTNWLLPALSCLQTSHSAALPLVVDQLGWVPHVFLSPRLLLSC